MSVSCNVIVSLLLHSNMKSIRDITQQELKMGIEGNASWHKQYGQSAYVFVGKVFLIIDNILKCFCRWFRL